MILDTCPLQILRTHMQYRCKNLGTNSIGNLVAATVSTSAILFKVVRGYCRGEPQNIARGGERGG